MQPQASTPKIIMFMAATIESERAVLLHRARLWQNAMYTTVRTTMCKVWPRSPARVYQGEQCTTVKVHVCTTLCPYPLADKETSALHDPAEPSGIASSRMQRHIAPLVPTCHWLMRRHLSTKDWRRLRLNTQASHDHFKPPHKSHSLLEAPGQAGPSYQMR